MPRYGRDRNRIEGDQLQATEHPVRMMIVQLFTRNRLRPMEVNVLVADLLTEFPDLKAEEVRPANVAYHVAVLRDAELLPSGYS
jgi:hypothetical protein